MTIEEAYDAILRELDIPIWKLEPGGPLAASKPRIMQILANLPRGKP